MRLPWPLSRLTEPAADAEGGPSVADLPGAPDGRADAGPADRLQAPPTGAWTSLPPIQRSIGDPPVVAPASTFLAGVPGARPLPPIVDALGHDVSPIAPSGLVAAPARPVSSLTSTSTLVQRPVQRRPADDVSSPWTADVATEDVAPFAEPARAAPVRTLGVVPTASVAVPPERPLTTAEPLRSRSAPPDPPATRPAGQAVQREAAGPAPGGPVAPRASGEPARAPVPGASTRPPRRPGLGAPIASVPTHALGAGHGATQRQRPTAAEVATDRAAVVGASLPSSSGTAAMPVASAAGQPRGFRATAGASPIRTTVQRKATGEDDSGRRAGDERSTSVDLAMPAAPRAQARPASKLPVLRAVPASRQAGDDDPNGRAVALAGAPGPLARSAVPSGSSPSAAPATARPARRPLTGARPALSVSTVQRSGADPDDASNPPHPGGPAASPGASDGAASEHETFASATTFYAASGSGPVSVQRSAARSMGRASGSTVARSTPLPFAASPGSPRSDDSLPLAASAGNGIVSVPAEPSSPSPAAGSQSGAQSAPLLGPVATAVVQRVDGAAPPAPTEPEGHSESDLDDLARKLFGRFRNRLRAELIYEREAKGLSFDN